MPSLLQSLSSGSLQTSILQDRPQPRQTAALCDTESMSPSVEPKSVDVNVTKGTGVEIEWRDGHRSSYSFHYLRDACPCALCNEERDKSGRKPGEAPGQAAGALPLFRPALRPTQSEAVGRYAIRFTWNDGHQHGIFAWDYLREICPCPECKTARAAAEATK